MSLQILVDMNLSPGWVDELARRGWSAVHWSSVGDPRAADQEIMRWARSNGYVVFTHDLDFGTALALTHAAGPSVLQMRTQDVLPGRAGAFIAATLRQHESDLAAGALVVVDEAKARVRVFPCENPSRHFTVHMSLAHLTLQIRKHHRRLPRPIQPLDPHSVHFRQ